MKKKTIIITVGFLIILIVLMGYTTIVNQKRLADQEKIIGVWERIEPQDFSVPLGTVFNYTADGYVIPQFDYEYYWTYWFEDGYLYEHTYYATTNEPTEWGRQKFEYKLVTDDIFELVGGLVETGSKIKFIFHRIK